MKVSAILSEIDRQPLSTHSSAAMLVGYLNSELMLLGDAALTTTSTGTEAITAIYRSDSTKQETIFQKEFVTLRKKDSYKFSVLALAVFSVVAGLIYAGSVARLEGEVANGMTDVFKVLITGLFEIAKLLIAN